MTNHDLEYYSRREREERERAAGCDDHGARMIHLELANRYQAMLGPLPQYIKSASAA